MSRVIRKLINKKIDAMHAKRNVRIQLKKRRICLFDQIACVLRCRFFKNEIKLIVISNLLVRLDIDLHHWELRTIKIPF